MHSFIRLAFLYFISLLFVAHAQAAGLSVDQLRMVEQLSPQDKASLAKQYGVSSTKGLSQESLSMSEPKVVTAIKGVDSKVKPSSVELSVWKRLGMNSQATDSQATDSQATDSQATDSQATDSQATDSQATDSQATDSQATDSQATDLWESWLGDSLKEDKKLVFQFGYDLFAGSPTTFAPVTEIPVPSEYVIGPGDELNIRFYGKRQDSIQVVVARDGMVALPDVGELSLLGLKFAEAKALIAEEVHSKILGVTVSISMGKLRSMRVFVLGDVNHPGSYLVSSLSTISNAIFVSGGISKHGSLRNIVLKRKGRAVAHLDLYDFLLKGNSRGDVTMLPGDVVFVPPLGKTVTVYGEVNRPAIYEIKGENTVAKVLKMAGGLTAHADPLLQQLDRIGAHGERFLLDLKHKGKSTHVRNGDVVLVHSAPVIEEKQVELLGQVKRPGKYEFVQGMTLKDMIASEDDLLDEAYLDAALIQRNAKHDNKTSVVRVNLRDLFSGANLAWPTLQEGDKIYVFSQNVLNPVEHVEASGEFMKPGFYPLGEGMTLTNLVFAAGGMTEKALLSQVEVTRYEIVDGQKRQSKYFNVSLKKALAGDEKENIILQPHDVVTIRQLSNWRTAEHVVLSGEFVFQGSYPIEDGEKLSGLIRRSGGFTDKAYLKAAVFTRESIRKEQQKQIDDMVGRMEADIAQEEESIASLSDAQLIKHKQSALLAAKRVLGQMKEVKASGRLVIQLDDIKRLETSEFNLTLRDGDKLYVPKKPDEVMVMGQVYNTTALLYRKKYDLEDYVDAAGGMTRLADESRMYVVRANGMVERASSWGKTHVYPGDVVVVPQELEQFSLLNSTLDWSRVLMQVGVGLASMKTIGVF